MASCVEADIGELVAGRAPLDECEPLVDFSLEEQRSAAEAAGAASLSPIVRPKLGETLTLVVANAAIGPRGEVMMVQEAKRSCAGKWYLPAGRVRARESLADAAAREMKEETGVEGAPRALLAVECAHGCWFRFLFATDARGGELKTPARADAESLQAKWVAELGEVALRSDDILPLVELARAHRSDGGRWHADALPAPRSHSTNLLRVVAVSKRRSNNKAHVLLGERTRLHLPVAELDPNRNVHSTLRRFLVEVFGAELPEHRPRGLLAVEHAPAATPDEPQTDGVCLTLLVGFRSPIEEAPIIGKYAWHELEDRLGEELLAKASSKNATIHFRVVR